MNAVRSICTAGIAIAALATVTCAAGAQASATQDKSSTAALPATPVNGMPVVQLDYRGRHLALITMDGGKSVLTLESADGSDARTVAIPGGCEPTAVRWARRWDRLAILTRCATSAAHPQPNGAAWEMDVQAGKPPRKLVDFIGTASAIQWRSDGKVVAFLYTPATGASGQPPVSRIVAGPIDGGAFGPVSPAGLSVRDFYLSAFGNGVLFTATPATSPDALPALYEAVDAKVSELFDPATTPGSLHGVRIGRLRFSPAGGTRAVPVFFLGRASEHGPEDLYLKLARKSAPIVNLTTAVPEAQKPGWFEPSGDLAIATHVADGVTQLTSYIALATGTGLFRSTRLCSIAGVITDGSGAGSMSTNGGRYAYFEYPKAGGAATLNVGFWRVGMACRPRWTRPAPGVSRVVAVRG